MGFFSRHRKAFRSVIASFGMLFGLLAGVSVTTNVGYAKTSGSLNKYTISSLISVEETKKDGNWNFNNSTSISGRVTGTSTAGDVIKIEKHATIRITNIAGATIGISFNWSASIPSNGSLSVAGQGYTGTQNNLHYENASLTAGKSFEIALMAKGEKNTTRIDIFDIVVAKITNPTITFSPANHGTFSVDGAKIENDTQLTKNSWVGYELSATPNTGYDFFGWQVSNSDGSNPVIISHENPYLLQTGINSRVTAVFKTGVGFAVFHNDSLFFDDLAEAINHANSSSDKIIFLSRSGWVKAGNYTLNSELSLLIPNNKASALDDYATKDPRYVKNTASRCFQYSKLTFQSGANLTVKGQVVVCCTPAFKTVGGEFSTHTAIPSGAYGQIEMRQGSSMVIESGAKLFAWGFVTGDGIVEAKNGSTVYELFQMASWRGGSVALEMNGNSKKVFLINQYYVQNIECALKLWSGATEQTLTGTYMSKWGMEDTPRPTFVFIGQGGMFNLTSGYLIKKYNPSTDRMSFEIFGNGLLSSIAFKLTILKVNVDLDSKSYVLPINNNLTITIKQGFSCSTNQDLDLLPGSELIVEQGGSFEVQTGHYLTVYDLDNWGNYATETKLRPVAYSPTRTKTRTEADLADAKIALDGTLTIDSKSYLMTTGKNTDADIGARIISPGRTGVIKLTDAGATSYPDVYQYNNGTYVAIDHSCAKLQNGDHSYVQSAPGNTYTYDKVLDRWNLSANPPVKTGLFKTLDGNTIQTVLLHDDVKQSNYTGLFYYSKDTSAAYNAADERYYYLNKGVVSKRNEWWKDATKGAYYHFGPNQYAYQSVSVVLSPTASGDNPARGIKARYFFDTDAKLLRMVSVDSITSNFSSGMTITSGICYYNGIKAGFGLFENQSHVYLAKDDGSLMTNGTYYVPSHKINNIKDSSGKVLTAGLYYFDKNGHMYDSNFKEITRGTAS